MSWCSLLVGPSCRRAPVDKTSAVLTPRRDESRDSSDLVSLPLPAFPSSVTVSCLEPLSPPSRHLFSFLIRAVYERIGLTRVLREFYASAVIASFGTLLPENRRCQTARRCTRVSREISSYTPSAVRTSRRESVGGRTPKRKKYRRNISVRSNIATTSRESGTVCRVANGCARARARVCAFHVARPIYRATVHRAIVVASCIPPSSRVALSSSLLSIPV